MYLTARFQFQSFRQTWGLQTDKLIVAGIYGLVRHPQNVGWGLLLAAVALLGRSGAALALIGVYGITCLIWLPLEEAFLARRFGEAYDAYRRSTPAVIPWRLPRKNQPSPGTDKTFEH